MFHSEIVNKARQGNPDAIATLITTSLVNRGITVKASRSGKTLLLSLKSSHPLEQLALSSFLSRSVRLFALPDVSTLEISAFSTNPRIPDWSSQIDLATDSVISQSDCSSQVAPSSRPSSGLPLAAGAASKWYQKLWPFALLLFLSPLEGLGGLVEAERRDDHRSEAPLTGCIVKVG